MTRIAVYPGSFDPITVGHIDIINRVAKIFDQVVVLIANSNDKTYLFTAEEREHYVKKVFQGQPNIEVALHDGLTIDFMQKKNAQVIIRGLRAVADFEYEGTLASMNHRLAPQIETFMVFSRPEYYYISSRGVKELARNGGSTHGLVPDFLEPILTSRLKAPVKN